MQNQIEELVSVIIPFFNEKEWLCEAIESVIAQTHICWELILVDDGSEQKSSNIAIGYSKKYPGKIIYIDHPGHENRGVTKSRNTGVCLSEGNFISFLDADDCWLPHKLEQQLQVFAHHSNIAMICEASRFWYSWNNASAKDIVIDIGVNGNAIYDPPQLMKSLYPLGIGAPPCPTGIMIKKEAFNRSGGFEETFCGEYQLYEDQAFLSKIYLNEQVYISSAVNNMHRKRPGSLTESANDEVHYKKVKLFYLSWLEAYIQKHNLHNNDIAQLIQSAKQELNTKG